MALPVEFGLAASQWPATKGQAGFMQYRSSATRGCGFSLRQLRCVGKGRKRFCFPTPHVTEQGCHSPQSATTQAKSLYSGSFHIQPGFEIHSFRAATVTLMDGVMEDFQLKAMSPKIVNLQSPKARHPLLYFSCWRKVLEILRRAVHLRFLWLGRYPLNRQELEPWLLQFTVRGLIPYPQRTHILRAFGP